MTLAKIQGQGLGHDLGRLAQLVSVSPILLTCLNRAAESNLDDWWLCGGIIRETIWGLILQRPGKIVDIDLIYYDARQTDETRDKYLEMKFGATIFGVPWSIKNQARMWQETRDPPYRSAADALTLAPDTVSSVGIKKDKSGTLVVFCPYGLQDLFQLRFRPTSLFIKHHGVEKFFARIQRKDWLRSWPEAQVSTEPVEFQNADALNHRLQLGSF